MRCPKAPVGNDEMSEKSGLGLVFVRSLMCRALPRQSTPIQRLNLHEELKDVVCQLQIAKKDRAMVFKEDQNRI